MAADALRVFVFARHAEPAANAAYVVIHKIALSSIAAASLAALTPAARPATTANPRQPP